MNDTPKAPSDPKPPARVSLFSRRSLSGSKQASPPPKKRKPRGSGLSVLSAFLSFVLVGAVVGLAGFGAALVAQHKPGPLTEDKVVIITREDDGGPIGEQLERAGVIDNATLFSAMTVLDGSRSALKRGEYAFKAGVSLHDVEQLLDHHKVVQHKLTIPEGLTSEQIAQRLRDDEALGGDVKDTPREGSLYPDTYFFERGDSRQALLTRMAATQTKAVNEIWKKRVSDLPIKSPGELVTLASVVEKETGKSDERPRVAGVFINRLLKHMRLQSDPTIVYGLVYGRGTLGHPITRVELEQPTAYNTYFIDGLPPGPICNPGRAAMEAVANPAHTRDIYFVADGTGGHAFAETLEQHKKNVDHWRQIEKDAKDRLSPDATPPANTRGELDDPHLMFGALTAPALDAAPAPPRAFGALALAETPAPAPASAALSAKLVKVASSMRKRQDLLEVGGALSAQKIGGKSIEDLGAVITGVNDDALMPDDFAASSSPPGSVSSYPLSPAALADQKARELRYGIVVPSDSRMALADSAPPPGTVLAPGVPRAHAFDASEGTKFDPLKNRTWDLSYAHEIPVMK